MLLQKQCGGSPSVSSRGLAFSWVGLSVGAGWRTRLNTSLKCSDFSCSPPTTDSNLIGALQSFTLSVHREAAYCCQAETLLGAASRNNHTLQPPASERYACEQRSNDLPEGDALGHHRCRLKPVVLRRRLIMARALTFGSSRTAVALVVGFYLVLVQGAAPERRSDRCPAGRARGSAGTASCTLTLLFI